MTPFLYYPVKPIIRTQDWNDQALQPYYKANGINFSGHNGIDYAASHGTPIRAAHSGIAYYEIDGNQGHGVCIKTEYPIDGYEWKTIYWHLCDPVKEPQFASPIYQKGNVRVQAGAIIGYMNSTGLSTGDHLHFGLKRMLNGVNIDAQNGYYGATDPNPYFLGIFAENATFKFTKYLIRGSWGVEVYNLQKFLVSKGYGSFIPTSFFGPKTEAAVKAFQKANGIQETGTVGPITRNRLNELYS